MHPCTHTARIGKTSLYFNGVQDCMHFFFSSLLSFLSFSYIVSFFCILPFLFPTIPSWADEWMYSNKPRGGWLHTKDMAVHVWTGVDVEVFCLLAAYELGGYYLFFFSPFCFFLMSCLTMSSSSLAGHRVSLYYYYY
ncbi:hypothetical protein ASPFODRAFT_443105 [Aspergillus luchuensis CBS 106.47]|uniref:Uncharacterized protein n=1 Tax=Aspergillus luchuensis (strain CBS 106.47) TaxID=1137211 RepID=A0A1M3TW43_ASPLC|nr:hypothetical protein ASPFODRAFT_443105 [Aspergillus luchuensis CBS 106.47]